MKARRAIALSLALAACQGPPARGGARPFFADAGTADAGAAEGMQLREDFWITGGPVFDVLQYDGLVYVAGEFDYVGPDTGAFVAIDRVSAAAGRPWPRVDASVSAIASDGAGGWYIGGTFAWIGNSSRRGIAHLLASGELDHTFIAEVAGDVRALAVSGDTVYVGGDFDRVADQVRDNLAALDATTGALRAWNPGAREDETGQAHVDCLAFFADSLVIGGRFTSLGGQSRNGLAAVHPVTGAVAGWNPGGAGSEVDALATAGDAIYIGGQFTALGGQTRGNLAAVDADGVATAWDPGSDGPVQALAIANDGIVVGGEFTTAGGQPRRSIAQIDADTGLATGWSPDPDGRVLALAVDGETVYAGGDFTAIGGRARRDLAALDGSGAATSWNPVVGPTGVYALALKDGALVAGGNFASVGGTERHHLAAFDPATGAATDWNPEPDSSVTVLAARGGTLYAAGGFSQIGGQPRGRLAALDTATGAATDFDAGLPGGFVSALAVTDDALYIGGSFSDWGGAPREHLAALDPTTGAVLDWNPGTDPWVTAIAVADHTVYVGGHFSRVGGQPRACIAAVDALTGAVTDWDPGPSLDETPDRLEVAALEVQGGAIVAAGSFSRIGGEERVNIAAVDRASGRATTWESPEPRGGYPTVRALAMAGDTIYAGGQFRQVKGRTRLLLVPLDATTGEPAECDAGMDGSHVDAASATPDLLVVGGLFRTAGHVPREGIAAFDL